MNYCSFLIEKYTFKAKCLSWIVMIILFVMTLPALVVWLFIHEESCEQFLDGVEWVIEDAIFRLGKEHQRLKGVRETFK